MNLKTLAIVTGVLVALAVAGGLLKNRSQGPAPADERVGGPLMQAADTEGARQIRLASAEATTTLQRGDNGWTVKEQQGFAANEGKLRHFLLKLAQGRVERRVTDEPGRFAALGLLTPSEAEEREDATAESAGTLLSIAGADGEPAYRVVLAPPRQQDARGRGSGARYVRFLGSDTAYLASTEAAVSARSTEWVRSMVTDFDADKLLQRFTIRRPGREPVRFSRPDEESGWTLEGVAADRLDTKEVEDTAKGLADLFLVEIADPSASAADLGRGRVATVEMALFDGRRYTLEVGEETGAEGYRYMTVSASLSPDVDDSGLQEEVDAFNRRFRGRMLAVHDWVAKRVVRSLDQFLKST